MKNFRARLLASTLMIGASVVVAPAYAQAVDDGQAVEESTDGQAIVVTGSRIARPDLDATSPVTTVSAEQFDLTGTVTVETLLNDLPQLIPGNTRVSNNQGGEDFSTLDLRGLGPQRTLILVDGERVPPSSSSGVVDIGTIPAGLIERVDVVTGGASAVYGSDAIAGVVNFVLKHDYEGMEVRAQQSITNHGDGNEFNVQGLFGGNFDGGRGNMTFFASYYTRDAVGQGDRDFSRRSGALFFGPNGEILQAFDPSGLPAGVDLVNDIYQSGGSATAPWGAITGASNLAGTQFRNLAALYPDRFGAGTNPTGCPASSTQLSFNGNNELTPYFGSGNCVFADRSTGSSRYNFNPVNLLVTPYERYTMTVNGHYDVTDKITFRLLANYSDTSQTVNLAPTPATGIVVPYNSPLIPSDLAAALATRTYFTRVGTGGRYSSQTACTNVAAGTPVPTCNQVSAATEPFVMSRRFSETGPRIGEYSSRTNTIRGSLEGDLGDRFHWDATLSWGQVNSTAFAQGNINKTAVTQGLNGCPAGSLPGCVPLDIFGANTITPAMLNFVRVDTKETRNFEQVRAVANITGQLFELPGGPVGIAAGVETRTDRGAVDVDDAQRTGNIYGFNAVQSQKGSVTTHEVYGEIRLPVLGDLPFIRSLTLEAGARYSDYSSVGSLTNYKIGGEWEPFSWLRFRGIYNKAARAPSIAELFQNGDQGFYTVADPCNANALRTPTILANCQAAAPAANFTNFQQANQQLEGYAFGNTQLSEERGETYTLGAVLSANNLPLGRATLSVDYYNIKLDDIITTFGPAFFLNQCYSQSIATACARIIRDPNTGQVTRVNTATGNSGVETTDGIDAHLNWVLPLSDLSGSLPGRLRIDEVFTWVNSFKIDDTEYVGLNESGIGGGFPRYKSTLSVIYDTDSFSALMRWNYASKLQEDFYGDPDLDPVTPALSYFDLSLTQRVGDNFELTGIVSNVFNAKPQITPVGYFDQGNVDTVRYSNIILGQTFTVAARVRF